MAGIATSFLLSLSFFSLCNKYTTCLLKRTGKKGWNKIGRQQKVSSNIPFKNPYNKIFSRLIDLPAIFKPTDFAGTVACPAGFVSQHGTEDAPIVNSGIKYIITLVS